VVGRTHNKIGETRVGVEKHKYLVSNNNKNGKNNDDQLTQLCMHMPDSFLGNNN
jgi:hypothetical protein